MRSARILLVTSEKGLRGGERQLQLLASGLAGKGHELALAAPAGAAVFEGWRGSAFAVAMANEVDLRAVLGLRRAASTFKPDLIHAFTSRAHGLVELSRIRAPLVVTRAVSFPAGANPLGRRKYQRGVAAFVAVSGAVREALLEAGADPQVVEVISPGVPLRVPDARAAQDLRTRLIPAGGWVLCAIGALEPAKGFDLLIRALPLLVARGEDAHLLLLGRGPSESALLALSTELGVESRVHLLPESATVEAVLASAQVFVSPSVLEGFGMALVEAMGAGVPVVATDSGGSRHIVRHGENGALLRQRDPRALADALLDVRRALAAGGLSRQLELARQTAANFSADRMVERTDELYRRVIARGRRAPES